MIELAAGIPSVGTTAGVLIAASLLSVVLFLAGVPIVLVFGVWVVLYHLVVPQFPMQNMSVAAFSELQSFAFLAIPLFILVGDLIYEGDISADLIEFSRSVIGWFPGSTGNAALGCCAIFSAITGSNTATTAAVGKALHPSMVEEGYDRRYAAATVAAGGTVGAIIPPSILLIVYGVTFGVSIPDLFLAGVIPGLAMVAGLVIVNTVVSRRRGYGMDTASFDFDPGTVLRSAWRAKLGLGTIVVLLGGIFGGVFTPSEAAAVAVGYILLTGMLTNRTDDIDQVIRASFTSLILVGVIIPTVVFAVLIQQNLSFLGVQDLVAETILGLGNQWLIILAMIIILLITGSTLSSIPNIVLTAPLLTPVAITIGLDPVMWGVLFMMSDAIGFITPPYGLNLYVISGITGIDYVEVAYAGLSLLAVLIAVWIAFLLYPELNFVL
jgi:C4-dicarboxylate transporter DctM subunit